MYKLYFTQRAKKDAKLIKASNLQNKTQVLLDLITQDPYAYPPEFEFLKGDLKGAMIPGVSTNSIGSCMRFWKTSRRLRSS